MSVRFSHPPLAGDAFVNQGLAVGGEDGDLGFDAMTKLDMLNVMMRDFGDNFMLNG